MISDAMVQMVGLNFYPPSVRCVESTTDLRIYDSIPRTISRVGVFVNEDRDVIDQKARRYGLDYIQLHGDESLAYCRSVAEAHRLIKVFRIKGDIDPVEIAKYDFAEFFIFDTASIDFGGSGKKFDWSVLDAYRGPVPFLLSGGIGPKDVDALLQYSHPQFAGIDINSKFESSPGIKSEALLRPFIHALRTSITDLHNGI